MRREKEKKRDEKKKKVREEGKWHKDG